MKILLGNERVTVRYGVFCGAVPMKRWCAVVFPFLVGASCLCGYASPQDRQYVDYFLHLQAADLFRTQSFLLNWSCAYMNVNKLQGVDLSFSCYRSLSLNAARKLLVSIAEDMVNRINKDPSIQERHLLPEPFNLNQLYLKIETENVFSAQADTGTIRVMTLDRGNITYETYRGSTLFYGRTLEYHETLEMARMLLGEVPAFDEKPMPPQAAGFKATVAQPALETPPSQPDRSVEEPQVKQLPPEQPLRGSKVLPYTKEVLPPTAFPEPGPEVPLSESSSLDWKEASPGLQQIQATGSTLPAQGSKQPVASQAHESSLKEGASQLTGMAIDEEAEQPQSHPNMPVESSNGLSEATPLNTLDPAPLSEEKLDSEESQGAASGPNTNEQPEAKLIWSDDQAKPPEESKDDLPKPTEEAVPDASLGATEQKPTETTEEASSFLAWVAKQLDSPSVPEETADAQPQEPSPQVLEEIAENPPEEQEPTETTEEASSFLAWVAKQLDSPSVPEETADVQPQEPSPQVLEEIAENPPEEQEPTETTEEASSFLAWVAKKLDSPSVPEETADVQPQEPSPQVLEEIAENPPEEQEPTETTEEASSFLAWVAKKLDSPSVPEETADVQPQEPSPQVLEEIAENPPEEQATSSPEEPSSFLAWVAMKLDSPSASEETPDVPSPEQPEVVSDGITKSASEDQQVKSEDSSSVLGWITSRFGSQTEESATANDVSTESEQPLLVDERQGLTGRSEEPPVASESLQSESPFAAQDQTVAEEPVQAEEGDDTSKIIMHPPHEVLDPMPIEAPEPQSSFIDRWFGWMKPSTTEESVQTAKESSEDVALPVSEEPSETAPVESSQPQQDLSVPVPDETSEPQDSYIDRWFGWMIPSSKEEPAETTPSQPVSENVAFEGKEKGDQPEESFGDHILGWFKSTSEDKAVADVYEPAPLPPVIDDTTDAPSDKGDKDDQASQETRSWYARLGSIFSSSSDNTASENQEDALIAEEDVGDSDEEALAWVERFGSWSREKISDNQNQESLTTIAVASHPQPESVEQPQVQALGKEEQTASEKDVVHEGSQALVADRLGDVSRPDEVWKDLDQDDYCPDDDEDIDEDLDEDIQSGSSSRIFSTRQVKKARSGSAYFRPAE